MTTSLSGIAGIGTAGKSRGGFAIRSGDGEHMTTNINYARVPHLGGGAGTIDIAVKELRQRLRPAFPMVTASGPAAQESPA